VQHTLLLCNTPFYILCRLDSKQAPNHLCAIPGAGHVPFDDLYLPPYNTTFFGFLAHAMLDGASCPPPPPPPAPPADCAAALKKTCPGPFATSDACLACAKTLTGSSGPCYMHKKVQNTYCNATSATATR
jgi:hypothetical protein